MRSDSTDSTPFSTTTVAGRPPVSARPRLARASSRAAAWLGAVAALGLSLGCETGGVGDPCTPEDEYFDNFSGFSLGEVNVESRSFQCETRVCLVNKFQGRVSCPYGTNGSNPDPTAATTVDHPYSCEVPVFGGPVTVPVQPWRTERKPELAVYCSCRCSGDDPNARYCECPSGFSCTEVIVDQNRGQEQLAGSYCVRSGSDVDPLLVDSQTCELNGPGEAVDPLRDLTCGPPPSDYSG